MKNRILTAAFLLAVTASMASAQIKIGIRGGINAARLKSDDVVLTPLPTEESNYKITLPKHTLLGYHIGLIGQIKLFNFFIQPEALYTLTRNNINIYDLNSATPDKADEITQKLNRIDIPVLFGLKFSVLKLGLGPVFTFLISDNSDLKKITEYDLKLNKATVGYQAGIGLEFNRLTLDLKYEGSLSKLSDGINIGNGNKMAFDSRINQVILSAGIFF